MESQSNDQVFFGLSAACSYPDRSSQTVWPEAPKDTDQLCLLRIAATSRHAIALATPGSSNKTETEAIRHRETKAPFVGSEMGAFSQHPLPLRFLEIACYSHQTSHDLPLTKLTNLADKHIAPGRPSVNITESPSSNPKQ